MRDEVQGVRQHRKWRGRMQHKASSQRTTETYPQWIGEEVSETQHRDAPAFAVSCAAIPSGCTSQAMMRLTGD
ncbi:MAG: hypothetical protein LBK01_07050 [Burkholderiaceae bacterium]|nr:hypothetical protein [Burkholderiaceae bacterium]